MINCQLIDLIIFNTPSASYNDYRYNATWVTLFTDIIFCGKTRSCE